MRCFSLLLLALAAPALAADNWPAFRGGPQAGVAEGKALPNTWDKSKNVAWKVDVPGAGWSSPIVWGKHVFLTATVSTDKQPEPRKGLYIGDLQGKPRKLALIAPDVPWYQDCINDGVRRRPGDLPTSQT